MTINDLIVPLAVKAGRAIMDVYAHPDTDWQVERKADNSPLTLADRRSHAVIAAGLADTNIPVLSEEGEMLPYAERRAWREFWLVDPLDGTKEFLKRNGEFTVNIALISDGKPVRGVIYVPAQHRLYYGDTERGAFVADVSGETDEVGEWTRLPAKSAADKTTLRFVASRSHLSAETRDFIESFRSSCPSLEMVSAGSSLKFCLVAEGNADIYPRLAPTMEWDTGAGHAIVAAAGYDVTDFETGEPLRYNKEDLHNPFFLVR